MGATAKNSKDDHGEGRRGSISSHETEDDAATEKAQAKSKPSSRRKRIKQSRIPADDFRSLIQTNAHFYSAFSSLDMKAMEAVWLEDGRCICHFPGMKRLVGYNKIMKSFRHACDEMDGVNRRNWMEPTEVQVEFQTSEKATIFCQELMYSIHCSIVEGQLRPESELIKKLSATNAFKKVDGKWHLWYHQATAMSDSETEFKIHKKKDPVDAPPMVAQEEHDQENAPPVVVVQQEKDQEKIGNDKKPTAKSVTQKKDSKDTKSTITEKKDSKDTKSTGTQKKDNEVKKSTGTQKKDSKEKKSTGTRKKDQKDKKPMATQKKDNNDRKPMSPTARAKKPAAAKTKLAAQRTRTGSTTMAPQPPTETEYSEMTESETFDTFQEIQEILREKNPKNFAFDCAGL